jgi:multidrug resistance efflux pump
MSIKALGFLSRKRVGYVALALAVALGATFALYSIYHSPSSSSAAVTRTVKVTKGTVQASVSASGNISTVETANERLHFRRHARHAHSECWRESQGRSSPREC